MSDLFQQNTFREYDEWLSKLREVNPRLGAIADTLKYPEGVNSFLQDNTLTNREYVETIALSRRMGYYFGSGSGNVAAKLDTDRQYSTDAWKFIEEFLQNADDCEYSDIPSISIEIDERIERNPVIRFTYNEKGFTRQDIWAITAFAESTKLSDLIHTRDEEGIFYLEKTGRKGRGFKSVFALDAENVIVHIRSNGFAFRLDNIIGCILPIWEGTDDDNLPGTRITVELIHPKFGFDEIVSEFGRRFCVGDSASMFTRSPFLFMHRIRSINIAVKDNLGCHECVAEYHIDEDSITYGSEIDVDKNKDLLGGIRHSGKYYYDQFQRGVIEINADEEFGPSPETITHVMRYTRMVEDDNAYRNYSIMAPIITGEGEANFIGGNLFRTFPLSKHHIALPIALDAPFVLELERDGIEYSPSMSDEVPNVPSNVWNTFVASNLFDQNGVLEGFLTAARSVKNIRMDRYIKRDSITLFDDPRNHDTYGNALVPVRDLNELCHAVPVFKLRSDSSSFTSYANARVVPPELYDWPSVDLFFTALLRSGYEQRVVDKQYVDAGLIQRELIDGSRLADAINGYLASIEQGAGPQSTVHIANDYIYPFLRDRRWSNVKVKQACLSNARIFYSEISTSSGNVTVREALSDGGVWLHDDATVPARSITRYRVFESSPADLSIMSELIAPFVEYETISQHFSQHGLLARVDTFKSWGEVRDLIVASCHFGQSNSLDELRIPVMQRYSLSAKLELQYNAFRKAGITSIIPDTDITLLSSFIGDPEQTIELLRSLGLKNADDYFTETGNYLRFQDDALALLGTDECDAEMIAHIKEAASSKGKFVDTTFSELCFCTNETLLLLLREVDGFISEDSIKSLCKGIQQERRLRGQDAVTSDLRNRAYHGSGIPVQNWYRRINIGLKQVLDYHLADMIIELATREKAVKIIVNNEGFFDAIPEEDMKPLLTVLGAKKNYHELRYYAGDLSGRGVEHPFLKDRGQSVYLNRDSEGDYKESLLACLKTPLNDSRFALLEEMENGYKSVRDRLIEPALASANHDNDTAYKALRTQFSTMERHEVIGVLSYYRYLSYGEGFGHGSQNSQKDIEADYRDDPWRFVYEFIQNVDDCSFAGKEPSLHISTDESAGTLVFEYNEVGFTTEDVVSLTSFGDSNKSGTLDSLDTVEGVFDREKTGRKGRGFKSVFSLPGNQIVVHICSNGFSFKLSKNLGSIIPIWEDCDNPPTEGTRITVEGFTKGYLKQLEERLRDMMGFGKPDELFATCPVLFLRKLSNVSVSGDVGNFSLSAKVISRAFGNESHPISPNDVRGIIHDGTLRQHVWEVLDMCVSSDEQETAFQAVRYSASCKYGKNQVVSTALAPIVTNNSAQQFNTGSLFRTLPLEDHELHIPIALNSQFEVDGGRSGLRKASPLNTQIVTEQFPKLLRGLLYFLRKYPDVRIERYVPRKTEQLFRGYGGLDRLDIRKLIRSFQILRANDCDIYVSCEDATLLPKECYSWQQPKLLCENYGHDWKCLVDQVYINSGLGIRKINLNNGDFARSLNDYLDALGIQDGEMQVLLREHIYPYLRENYDALERLYRSENRLNALREMKVFSFEKSDGAVMRENALSETVWVTETPKGMASFGMFRCVDYSSLEGREDDRVWYERMHDSITYQEAFAPENIRDYARKTHGWEQTANLITALLYYQADTVPLPYLSSCVLCEELDPTENVFRDAFIETHDKGIMRQIISVTDVEEIIDNAGLAGKIRLKDVAATLLRMGIHSGNDFFNDRGKGLLYLTYSTRTVLSSYCTDEHRATRVLDAIHLALRQRRGNGAVLLHVPYDDLKDCQPVVFTAIFLSNALGDDVTAGIAQEFCRHYPPEDGVDYAEAYIRALAIVGKAPNERLIHIALSDILDRALGPSIQSCKINNVDTLSLNIDDNVGSAPYEVQGMEKALEWLEADITASSRYSYHVTDLTEAFKGVSADAHYLLDDDNVYLDSSDPQNATLHFVRDRYRKEDKSFGILLDIVTTQNKLKSWTGTKYDFIRELKEFRQSTRDQLSLLAPNYDEHIEMATGQPRDCVIPELLQNINDCTPRPDESTRDLFVKIDSDAGTMMLCYDERGFDFANVYSITALGQSSKHDASEGEKGLGFKKVFSVFDTVDIYSNGFYFSLTRTANTIPKWISKAKRVSAYDKSGKTTMLFHAAKSRRDDLEYLASQWKRLVEGNFLDGNFSPVFLHNIDSIQFDGVEKTYLRSNLQKDFVFASRSILPRPLSQIMGEENDSRDGRLKQLAARLLTRKKIQGMTESQAVQYIDALKLEICIPKKSQLARSAKGRIYSTLPTGDYIPATILVNAPLELTTARNELMANSDYNNAVFEALLTPTAAGSSPFISMLEELARTCPNAFLADHMGANPKALVDWLCKYGVSDREDVLRTLQNAHLFRTTAHNDMQSLRWSYSVSGILWQYLKDVDEREADMREWVKASSPETSLLRHVFPKSKESLSRLKNFGSVVMPDGNQHPLAGISIEYFRKEFAPSEDSTSSDHAYNIKNAKDRFAVEKLLPYFVDQIESAEDPSKLIDALKTMAILPYRTKRGTRLGCLANTSIRWYFARKDDATRVSTTSYRIVDDSLLKDDVLRRLRRILIDDDLAANYSGEEVIRAIVSEMAEETDYTPRWWKYAIDVLEEWKSREHNVHLADATKSIRNKRFLFIEGEYSSDLKGPLIRNGVLSDVITPESHKYFWDALKTRSERNAATDMLVEMGVPHRFVIKGVRTASRAHDTPDVIHPDIIEFARKIAATIDFTHNLYIGERELCDLAQRLFIKHIRNESSTAFANALQDRKIANGIPIKNKRGEYVPLGWDLFYSKKDFEHDWHSTLSFAGRPFLEHEHVEQAKNYRSVSIPYDGDYERLIIDGKSYARRLVESLDTFHTLEESSIPYGKYHFGITSDASNFYKWLWGYSGSKELAHTILEHYTMNWSPGTTIPYADARFVIAVLGKAEAKNYRFDISTDGSTLFEQADSTNRIVREFTGINVLVNGIEDSDHFEDYFECRESILSNRDVPYAKKAAISSDPLWSCIYLVDAGSHGYGRYVLAKRQTSGGKPENVLLLSKNGNSKSHFHALVRYVADTYDIIADFEGNAKKEFGRLVSNIRSFLQHTSPKIPETELFQGRVNLEDIDGFGDEKTRWLELKKEINELISANGGIPTSLYGGKEYLGTKYHGICQLCYKRVPTGTQSGVFYTYRITKPSQNAFADLRPNLFCLCATCHGALGWGTYGGVDLTDITDKAKEYAREIEEAISSNVEQSFCVMEDFVDYDTEYKWFTNPVICKVTVNGVDRDMAFSWEHFMKIAFILSENSDGVIPDEEEGNDSYAWWED